MALMDTPIIITDLALSKEIHPKLLWVRLDPWLWVDPIQLLRLDFHAGFALGAMPAGLISMLVLLFVDMQSYLTRSVSGLA